MPNFVEAGLSVGNQNPETQYEAPKTCYFCAPLHFAHLALFAALIRARPAAEILRLGAIATTFRCPFTLAQRALCATAILARPAALIVRRPRVALVLFNPLNAPIAVSSAFNCCAALS